MPAEVKGRLPNPTLHSVQMDRHGLITAVIKVQRRLTEVDFLSALANAPKIGLPLVGVQYGISRGLAAIDYLYEGLDPGGSDSDNLVTYELDTSMSEEHIKTHPAWLTLKKAYGWDEEKECFPEYLPGEASKSSSSPLSKGKQRANGKSDLAGSDSYLNAGCVFRRSYAARSIPGSIMRGIGTIVKTPEGIRQFKLPAAARRRNWLKLAPRLRARGNAIEITEEYMLSGPNGWNEDIYGVGSLES